MKGKFNKILLALVAIAVLTAIYVLYYRKPAQEPLKPAQVTYNNPTDKTQSSALPASLQINVPFTPQAPTANWDELHNEACEEASAIMANAYFKSIPSLPPDVVEAEITKLTEWQDQNQGYHLDQTTAEAAKMIEAVYGLHTEIVPFDEQTIKQSLAANQLVIASFNGRLLGNPHFKSPGPIHHMLIFTGYNGDTIVTNDPGTHVGLNYQYDYNTLYAASADWDHSINSVDGTKKLMIIVSKN